MPYKNKETGRERHRVYMKEWVKRNRARHQALVSANNRRIKAEMLARLDTIKSVPCADCGGRFDPIAMDFDHVRGAKVGGVSVLVMRGFSWARLMEEVGKCEIVCSNCHRIRTRDRRNSRKNSGEGGIRIALVS